MHIKVMVFCWVTLSPRPQACRLVEQCVSRLSGPPLWS